MTNDDLNHDERAELQRLRALEAFDRQLNDRRSRDASQSRRASAPQKFRARARQARSYARWVAPVGAAMTAVGLLFLVTRTSIGVALGTCAVVALQAVLTNLITQKVLS